MLLSTIYTFGISIRNNKNKCIVGMIFKTKMFKIICEFSQNYKYKQNFITKSVIFNTYFMTVYAFSKVEV